MRQVRLTTGGLTTQGPLYSVYTRAHSLTTPFCIIKYFSSDFYICNKKLSSVRLIIMEEKSRLILMDSKKYIDDLWLIEMRYKRW